MSTQPASIETLMDMAMGVDRTWMKDATCRGWGRKPENQDNPNPWFAHNNKVYGPDRDIKGHQLIEYALIICAACPAQYDCARFAVKTGADEGTHGATISQIRWLQEQSNWEEIVDFAEVVSISVRQAIVTVRTERPV